MQPNPKIRKSKIGDVRRKLSTALCTCLWAFHLPAFVLETQISRPTNCSGVRSTSKCCGENISTSASNQITCSAPSSKSCLIIRSLARSIIIGSRLEHLTVNSSGNKSIPSSPNNM